MRFAWCAGGCTGASAGSCAAAEHGGDARGDGLVRLLRADEVDVRIEASCGDNATFAGDNVGAGAHDHGWVHAIHDVRIASFANAYNHAFFDANVRFDDAAPIDNQRVRDHGIKGLGICPPTSLAHAFTQSLAAAKLAFVAIGRKVLFDLDPEVRGPETHKVARCRAKHAAVGFAGHGKRADVGCIN